MLDELGSSEEGGCIPDLRASFDTGDSETHRLHSTAAIYHSVSPAGGTTKKIGQFV
jgi:hypothetical protein